LTPLGHQDWVVYAKRPFGGPEQVLKYLARYTHRVAISNQRLVSLEDGPGAAPAGQRGGTIMTTTAGARPAVEMADVIREYGEAFRARHGGWLTGTQHKALRDLAACRTAALGGHVEHCDSQDAASANGIQHTTRGNAWRNVGSGN
jgi:hypothetical protein